LQRYKWKNPKDPNCRKNLVHCFVELDDKPSVLYHIASCNAVEQMKRYRQMKDERDKLQNEVCQLRVQKDDFMDQCHRLREKIGKNLFLAVESNSFVEGAADAQ